MKDAGGWTWDSVTEDLSLSYHALIAGYKHTYVRDMPQRLELPGNFLAHVQQKNRWTKVRVCGCQLSDSQLTHQQGFFQVFRLTYWDILRSPKISTGVKWEAFCHITGPVQCSTSLLLYIVFPILQMKNLDTFCSLVMMAIPLIEPILSSVLTCLVKVPGRGRGEYRSWMQRSRRLLFVPVHFFIKIGTSLYESKSIVEGLISNDATFLTTPKEGVSSQLSSASAANPVKRQSIDDIISTLGLLLGAVRWMCLLHPTSTFKTWRGINTALWHFIIGFAFLLVNTSFLAEKYGWRSATSVWKAISSQRKLVD